MVNILLNFKQGCLIENEKPIEINNQIFISKKIEKIQTALINKGMFLIHDGILQNKIDAFFLKVKTSNEN